MVKVTETIKRIIKEKHAQLVSGDEAMRKLLADLSQQVRKELGEAALGSWNEYHLKQYLDAIERQIAEYDLAAQRTLGHHLDAMWDLGQASVWKPLEISGLYTGFNLSTSVLDTLKKFAFHKISKVSTDTWHGIQSELTLGIMGGKTPQQVADAIGQVVPALKVPERNIFMTSAQRAEVITKTEMGRVFSTAAAERRKDAAKYVDGMLKIWKHGHPKTPRVNHLGIDGQTRPENKPFNLTDREGNAIEMDRPHDPSAPIGEVINCQCDAVTWNSAWGKYPAAA